MNEALRHEVIWESRCIGPQFLDLGTSSRWVVSFTPLLVLLWGKFPRYPLDRRLGGSQSRSGLGEEKFLTVLRLELRPLCRPTRTTVCLFQWNYSFLRNQFSSKCDTVLSCIFHPRISLFCGRHHSICQRTRISILVFSLFVLKNRKELQKCWCWLRSQIRINCHTILSFIPPELISQ
jgi:hypothetical protein